MTRPRTAGAGRMEPKDKEGSLVTVWSLGILLAILTVIASLLGAGIIGPTPAPSSSRSSTDPPLADDLSYVLDAPPPSHDAHIDSAANAEQAIADLENEIMDMMSEMDDDRPQAVVEESQTARKPSTASVQSDASASSSTSSSSSSSSRSHSNGTLGSESGPGHLDFPYYFRWFAPFLSGGGYCSEATAFAVSLDKMLDPVHFTLEHHGDAIDPAYIYGLDDGTMKLLRDRMRPLVTNKNINTKQLQSRVVAVCHSEPGAWNPPRYETSLCPTTYTGFSIGRTMFETDRLPKGWEPRLNKMDEVWVPTEFHRRVFEEGGVAKEKM